MKKKQSEENTPALFGAEPAVAPPPVPVKKSSGLLAFSYSKLSMYTECPLKYKFKYLDKLKEEPKSYFAFGNSIHKALEFLHAVSNPPFPSIEEVLEFYKKEWGVKSWLEKGYKDPDKEAVDFQKGLEMLQAYYAHNKAALKPPFLLEYSTDVEVDGLKVRIIADRIEYLGGGEVEIIDYKTGKDVKRQPDQLYMYQKITELDPRLKEKIAERYGKKVSSVKIRQMLYYHVPTLKQYPFERADDKEIGVFWERVLGAAENIRGLKFEPNPGEFQCHFCDFKNFCPVHSASRKPSASSAPAKDYKKEQPAAGEAAVPPRGSNVKVEDLVDRYGHLKEEMDKLNTQLEEVARELGEIHAGSGKKELSGEKYSLELSRGENWKFSDREAVIGVLNEFDLYKKALGLTLPKIVAMLSDPAVPEDAKNKLKRHGVSSPRFEINLKRKKA
ncbi:MAG: PD-(D/E)XK nuclease family protein [Elusimicrobia bacterium]|nr:PD-(D/E)XK nuclease family protein [Elusimicrobiota bacterium]